MPVAGRMTGSYDISSFCELMARSRAVDDLKTSRNKNAAGVKTAKWAVKSND